MTGVDREPLGVRIVSGRLCTKTKCSGTKSVKPILGTAEADANNDSREKLGPYSPQVKWVSVATPPHRCSIVPFLSLIWSAGKTIGVSTRWLDPRAREGREVRAVWIERFDKIPTETDPPPPTPGDRGLTPAPRSKP